MENILFRADSSSTIGTGHIMRDLVLASKYKNSNIIFATQSLDGNINHKIIEAGYKVLILKSNDLKEVTDIIKNNNINMIVIDHYSIDYQYEKKLKKKSDVKILSFDDTYEKHCCDILLNHNISANPKRYKSLIPKRCKLQCGAKYTLLRDEFIQEKEKKKKEKNNKYKTIFLAMGGADHSNINIKILKVLEKFKNLKINLVTTTANQNLKELQRYVKNKEWVNLYIDSSKIAKLMHKSDLAIITPSVSANEVYYMEIPFIVVKTADNQEDMYKYLKKKKFLTLKQFENKKLKEYVELLLNRDNKYVK